MKMHACIMTIAGSDSGGGAGIQADLKTMTMLGGFGTSVITALTAQNGLGVDGIHAPEPEFVAQQLQTVLAGFPIAAAKTGMLFSARIIEAVADVLDTHMVQSPFPLVVDPVSISQSGHALLQPDAVEALVKRILPLATLVTPNKPEAEMLAQMSIETPQDVAEAARRILQLGAGAVLIKGGHFEQTEMIDWLCVEGCAPEKMVQEYVTTTNTHGTGCTLSAAIATGLGQGLELRDAVMRGQKFLNTSLRGGYAPGKGYGPPNHAGIMETALEVSGLGNPWR